MALAGDWVGLLGSLLMIEGRRLFPFDVWRRSALGVILSVGLYSAGLVLGADRNWIDSKIGEKLAELSLVPSPQAEVATLIRRLSFDLTGLPPQSQFADEPIGEVVDSLLNSPHFGERMASMWMNVARYAEDQAHQVDDKVETFYPNAYLYRQWVVDSFNADLPIDRFVKLQLAADLYEDSEKTDLPALGLIGLGPKYYERNRLNVMADEWEDRVDTVTRGLLGLTVACARCHDHKFDPITTEDYHALAGVFEGVAQILNDESFRPKEF